MTENAISTSPQDNSMVQAIRKDELVGRGSCSAIDECYSDAELLARITEAGITTRRDAVAWARRTHRMDVAMFNERSGW